MVKTYEEIDSEPPTSSEYFEALGAALDKWRLETAQKAKMLLQEHYEFGVSIPAADLSERAKTATWKSAADAYGRLAKSIGTELNIIRTSKQQARYDLGYLLCLYHKFPERPRGYHLVFEMRPSFRLAVQQYMRIP